MYKQMALIAALIPLAATAGPPKGNPLQPTYYTENRNTYNNNQRIDNSEKIEATANISTNTAGGNGGTGGAGGGGGAGGLGGAGGVVNWESGSIQAAGGAAQGGQAAGGSVGNINISNETKTPRIPVNTAYAPGLTSSGEDTCFGSVSGGAQHAVFGLSLAKTTTDANCVKLKRSKMLASLGERESALAYWCDQPDMKAALAMSGVECSYQAMSAMRTARLDAMHRAALELAKPAPATPVSHPKTEEAPKPAPIAAAVSPAPAKPVIKRKHSQRCKRCCK